MTLRKALGLAALGGVLTSLSLPDWNIFPLAWISLVPLSFAIEGCTPRQAFARGWVHGFVTNACGFYWVIHLLVTFGHMPWPIAAFLFSLLAAYQGLLYAAWAGLSRWLEDSARLPRALVRVAIFVALEMTIPFVFPWYLANSQWNFPLATQICDITGVLGLSAVLVGCSALLHELATRRPFPRRALAILVVLIAADLGYGAVRLGQIDARIAAAPKMRIGMVEGDIGIAEKAKPEHLASNLAIHQRLSKVLADGGAELIVWPESAYNSTWFRSSVERVPPGKAPLSADPAWDSLKLPDDGHLVLEGFPTLKDPERDREAKVSKWDRTAPQRGFKTPLLLGAITYEKVDKPIAEGRRWQRKVMNSALLLDEDGRVDGRIYHKNFLLVFGEYIPLGTWFPKLYEWLPEASAFTAGEELKVFELGKLRAGVMICYEAIIPRWTRGLRSQDPNVFINITNDAWFGKTGEPWMHFVLTMFRSVENRKALVRSTNTGVSGFVDPAGRLVKHTSVDHPEVLLHDVPLLEGGTVYRAVGDVVGWLSLLVVAGLAWRRRRS